MILPLAFITILNGFVFAIEVDELGTRLQHSVALFLTALALLFVVGSELPKTKYRTAIDKHIFFTNLLLMMSCVEAAVVAWLEDRAVATHVNAICTAVYSGTFVLYTAVIFIPLWLKRQRTIARSLEPAEGEVEAPLSVLTHSGQVVRAHRQIFARPGQIEHTRSVTQDVTTGISAFLANALFDSSAFPAVVFVKAGSERRLVFEHAARLRAGEACAMTLSSHPGFALARRTFADHALETSHSSSWFMESHYWYELFL